MTDKEAKKIADAELARQRAAQRAREREERADKTLDFIVSFVPVDAFGIDDIFERRSDEEAQTIVDDMRKRLKEQLYNPICGAQGYKRMLELMANRKSKT